MDTKSAFNYHRNNFGSATPIGQTPNCWKKVGWINLPKYIVSLLVVMAFIPTTCGSYRSGNRHVVMYRRQGMNTLRDIMLMGPPPFFYWILMFNESKDMMKIISGYHPETRRTVVWAFPMAHVVSRFCDVFNYNEFMLRYILIVNVTEPSSI